MVGPVLNFQGSRSADDMGLSEVGFTVEAGAFVQYNLSESVKLRSALRKDFGGHEGWIGNISADFVARRGDDWLLSVGFLVTFAGKINNSAYFSVAPDSASGLPAYSAGGGIHSRSEQHSAMCDNSPAAEASILTRSMNDWSVTLPTLRWCEWLIRQISFQGGLG